ncbi:MAG TPA: VOC family protein [Chloroflexia bacterium]|nr:VOC family protein [Chloroflexia bacterium]
MIRRVDHVVILVNDLAAASNDYTNLGFNVIPGGEHADGATHNALVAFADGSYLELIAFKQPAEQHRWWRYTSVGEGFVDFALLPESIESDMAEAQSRGLPLAGPAAGGRARPDGQQIQWQLGTPTTTDLPFLCADVTDRSLRVPAGEAVIHANGANGMAALTVVVGDLEASVTRYRALLGLEPATMPSPDASVPRTVSFILDDTRLILAQPSPEDIDQNMLAYLNQHGEGPYALALYSANVGGGPGKLNTALTHGAWLELVAETAVA